MKALEVLNQIKGILGIELSEQKVQLATMKLDNGTEIEAEEFVADKEVFIVGEEGEKIALPVGDYTLEDGKILSVVEEGLIAEIKDAAEEEADLELSAEVVEPIAHNPEAATEQKTNLNQNTNSHISRIRQMIYNQ